MSHDLSQERPGPLNPQDRLAGTAMAAASLLSVALMMAHPTAHGHRMADFAEEVRRGAMVNTAVHGGLIALSLVLAAGFGHFASRLGLGRFGVRVARTAYAAGVAGMIVAALISGVIVPEYFARYEGRPAEELEYTRHVLGMARATNQVCSRLAVMAMSVAAAIFGWALVKRGQRSVGGLGMAAGGVVLVAMPTGNLPMNVHGMLAFVGAQTVWTMGVAWLLLNERLHRQES
jgi:hypothetical protein